MHPTFALDGRSLPVRQSVASAFWSTFPRDVLGISGSSYASRGEVVRRVR